MLAALLIGPLALLQDSPPGPLLQESPGLQDEHEGEGDEARRHDRPTDHMEQDAGLLSDVLFDWFGLRPWLTEHGVTTEVLLTGEAFWAASGGLDPNALDGHGLLDMAFTLDTEQAFGHPGGTLLVGLQGIAGRESSGHFGLLQAASNIEADDRFQLARVWYEQHFERGDLALRVGKMDANGLFAFVDGGAGFVHSSMGFSPTILGFPTYPEPSFGAALTKGLGDGLELKLGVFDGATQEGFQTGARGPSTLFGPPSDLFLIGELSLAWKGAHPGRVGWGAWQHTGEFDRFDGGLEEATEGGYLTLDQNLWNDGAGAAEGRTLEAFLQLGSADPDVSPFHYHVGAGLACLRPFSSRLDDELGLGLTWVELSDQPGAPFGEQREVAFELFYGFEPLPWLRIKPDLQYVLNPGGDSALDDAFIVTLRTTMSL